jgi:hypothetical protein
MAMAEPALILTPAIAAAILRRSAPSSRLRCRAEPLSGGDREAMPPPAPETAPETAPEAADEAADYTGFSMVGVAG